MPNYWQYQAVLGFWQSIAKHPLNIRSANGATTKTIHCAAKSANLKDLRWEIQASRGVRVLNVLLIMSALMMWIKSCFPVNFALSALIVQTSGCICKRLRKRRWEEYGLFRMFQGKMTSSVIFGKRRRSLREVLLSLSLHGGR